jgi:hypothetical protein
LILCLILKVQNSYSQSLDSLPLKELNKEFLKGIQARERVVALQRIRKADSVIIHNYKDSVVPSMQHVIDTTGVELRKYYKLYDDSQSELKFYKKGFWGAVVLSFLLIIFN